MAPKLLTASLYGQDFHRWAVDQAHLLRTGRSDQADLDNIAEELETLGRSEVSALRASLRLIVLHLLKLVHQPGRASRSWRNTIHRERLNVEEVLDDNLSLKARLPEGFEMAFRDGERLAILETGLDPSVFSDAILTLDQVRDPAFLPTRPP